MTVEEIKNNIGQIVWHIGFGNCKIKEWDERNQLVILLNPKDNKLWIAEGKLHRLEFLRTKVIYVRSSKELKEVLGD